MKNIFPKTSFCLFFAIILVYANISFGQNNFIKLDNSTDSSYGYTAQNPLKLKKGNPGKSIDYSSFLAGLKTQDDQALIFLSRFTTSSPTYKEPAIRLNNRFTGLPISGKSGLLDNYFFLTSVTKDTINVFVDIYNKGTLMVPIGLKYQQPKK